MKRKREVEFGLHEGQHACARVEVFSEDEEESAVSGHPVRRGDRGRHARVEDDAEPWTSARTPMPTVAMTTTRKTNDPKDINDSLDKSYGRAKPGQPGSASERDVAAPGFLHRG